MAVESDGRAVADDDEPEAEQFPRHPIHRSQSREASKCYTHTYIHETFSSTTYDKSPLRHLLFLISYCYRHTTDTYD